MKIGAMTYSNLKGAWINDDQLIKDIDAATRKNLPPKEKEQDIRTEAMADFARRNGR